MYVLPNNLIRCFYNIVDNFNNNIYYFMHFVVHILNYNLILNNVVEEIDY